METEKNHIFAVEVGDLDRSSRFKIRSQVLDGMKRKTMPAVEPTTSLQSKEEGFSRLRLKGRKKGVMEKVLCVDDDRTLLLLYRDELSEEGYKVILAKNGQEALMKFEKESPDVVVMDIRMPVMDGIQTMTAMLGKNRKIPIILNTAYSYYQENFMTWGAEAYVIKSSDLAELKQKIREVLEKRKKSAKS
jgi:CheY-like chemotaxis protein